VPVIRLRSRSRTSVPGWSETTRELGLGRATCGEERCSEAFVFVLRHERTGDPVGYDVVHIGTALFRESRIYKRRWIGRMRNDIFVNSGVQGIHGGAYLPECQCGLKTIICEP
jgi:hypothetical protein